MKPGAKLATETYLEVRKISGEAWENDLRNLRRGCPLLSADFPADEVDGCPFLQSPGKNATLIIKGKKVGCAKSFKFDKTTWVPFKKVSDSASRSQTKFLPQHLT